MTPSAMPVRSLTQSLLRWPEPELVLHQVAGWAERMAAEHPGLERVGVFGSYGRGDAGVGSDLDLLLIDAEACGERGTPHDVGTLAAHLERVVSR